MTRLGFDLSNYDDDPANGHPFTAETVAALQGAGMTWAIVGCQDAATAAKEIELLQAAGVPVVGTYAFLYWGLDTTGQTQAAIDVAKAHGIPYVWLDCEAVAPNEAAGQTPASRTAQLRVCVAMVEQAGLNAGIYTGAYYWTPNMATTEFSRLPLWHASYYNDRHYQDTVDYGGWTQVAIHQYASAPAIAGRNRDYDVLFDWFAADAFPAQEDQLAQADIDRITALESELRDLKWAVFSGNEDRANNPAQRDADVAYRIAQRLGTADDKTVANSVADNAQVAINLGLKNASNAGMSKDDVAAIVGSELAEAFDAAKAASGGKS